MSDANKAIDYVIGNETFVGKGGVVVSHYEDPSTGEISNWGISLAWLKTIDPSATAETVRSLTRDAAVDLYRVHWFEQYKVNLIDSDAVAAKVLDMCVNCGPVTGVKMLQEALNEPFDDPAMKIVVDGHIGPLVAQAVRSECAQPNGEYGLLSSMVSYLEDHYKDIVKKNPAQAKNLNTWLKRAEKLPE